MLRHSDLARAEDRNEEENGFGGRDHAGQSAGPLRRQSAVCPSPAKPLTART